MNLASKREQFPSTLVERALTEGFSDSLSPTTERVRLWANAAPQRSRFAHAQCNNADHLVQPIRALNSAPAPRRREVQRESGRHDGGFTLIEIAVVLFLIALMTMAIVPSVKTFHVSRLKHEARRLAGRATFLYDQAAANKLVLRLTFNFDNQSYFVTRLDPHSPQPVFTADMEAGAAPVALPADVRIRDVTVENRGTVNRGTVSCNFYPEGYVDATVVHLIDPAGTVFTLSFQPLTGRVMIARGDLTPKAAQAQS